MVCVGVHAPYAHHFSETSHRSRSCYEKSVLMSLVNDLLLIVGDGKVQDVRIGTHWTAVTLRVGDEIRCGLATTLTGGGDHTGKPDVPQAGKLEQLSGLELCELIKSNQMTLRSVGLAAINASLPRQPNKWRDHNAEEVIAKYGEGKTVALVGRFPFIARLRPKVGELQVLEIHPKEGEHHTNEAAEILPQAEVVAITSMTLLNRTLDELLDLCPPSSIVLMLGPSTPLSQVLFDYSAHLLSGSIVTDIDAVLRAVSQGANFRQVHRAGVQLVTISRSDLSQPA